MIRKQHSWVEEAKLSTRDGAVFQQILETAINASFAQNLSSCGSMTTCPELGERREDGEENTFNVSSRGRTTPSPAVMSPPWARSWSASPRRCSHKPWPSIQSIVRTILKSVQLYNKGRGSNWMMEHINNYLITSRVSPVTSSREFNFIESIVRWILDATEIVFSNSYTLKINKSWSGQNW